MLVPGLGLCMQAANRAQSEEFSRWMNRGLREGGGRDGLNLEEVGDGTSL